MDIRNANIRLVKILGAAVFMGLFAATHCLGAPQVGLSNARPNIIFFLSDDMGWGEIEGLMKKKESYEV